MDLWRYSYSRWHDFGWFLQLNTLSIPWLILFHVQGFGRQVFISFKRSLTDLSSNNRIIQVLKGNQYKAVNILKRFLFPIIFDHLKMEKPFCYVPLMSRGKTTFYLAFRVSLKMTQGLTQYSFKVSVINKSESLKINEKQRLRSNIMTFIHIYYEDSVT